MHKTTVRRWIKEGLPTVGGHGKTLILGVELRAFLEARRANAKCPCPSGHLFCLKCRAPRAPVVDLTEFVPITATSGNLKAICPDCTTVMHQRMTTADLARLFPEAVVAPGRLGCT
jgi:nitrate/TMAO reductase-like tetraheme cytochrome c subunit